MQIGEPDAVEEREGCYNTSKPGGTLIFKPTVLSQAVHLSQLPNGPQVSFSSSFGKKQMLSKLQRAFSHWQPWSGALGISLLWASGACDGFWRPQALFTVGFITAQDSAVSQ